MLIVIVVLTLVSTWISLPGQTLDVAGIKQDVTVHEGLDLQGGVQVLLKAEPAPGQRLDSDVLNGTRNAVERRVNGLGVNEPVIRTRGNDEISVELPGVNDIPDCLKDGNGADCTPAELQIDSNGDGTPEHQLQDADGNGTLDCLEDGNADDCRLPGLGAERAVRVLQRTALLEIIDPQGSFLPEGTRVRTSLNPNDTGEETAETPAASPEASPVASPEAATAGDSPTGPVYNTIIAGDDLKDAFVNYNQVGQMVVGFQLNGDAASRFYDFTSTHLGQPMSIVIDKEVISSPVINGAISNEGVIEGVPPAQVRDLVLQLKAGALAVPLKVVQSRTVGPTLGQDSIDRSLIAGIIGLGTVALFMVLYYRLPGVLSVVALLIYTSITFALFKLIPVTLTLAGIAGFILSIGMAVDANVLIFARLKEELRTGRTLSSAIEAGFDHAWPSIRDSNISSMITAAILYWFGRYTGASIITGFALTLFVGVAVSMFTAITVTRTFLRLMVDAGMARHRSWFGLVDEPTPAPSPAD
ncbi:MAG: preprotein translocase subunit SecD [Thermomicrobiales bacterium]|nr:preprotein translocase subunit SecD [Thermomicrobiales bacterium]